MGFEVYVTWYDREQPARVPLESVRIALGASAHTEPDQLRLHVGSAEDVIVFVEASATRAVKSISVDRPPASPMVWDAIVRAMKLGHGLCFWPGETCAVARPEDAGHIPRDIIANLGDPKAIADGGALARLILS